MTETLKPCPFCNAEAELHFSEGESGKRYYWVSCKKCSCIQTIFDTPQEAIIAWNNRPIENELKSENRVLREALEEIVNQNAFSRYCDMSKFEQAVRDFNIQIDGIPLVRIAQSALKEIS